MTNLSLSHYSQQQKKAARDLAIADLINSLKKLKSGESLRFGSLGTFEKIQHQVKNNFKTSSSYGKTLVYYRINFRASSLLKREIDK